MIYIYIFIYIWYIYHKPYFTGLQPRSANYGVPGFHSALGESGVRQPELPNLVMTNPMKTIGKWWFNGDESMINGDLIVITIWLWLT